MDTQRTIIIVGASSDIGRELMDRYLAAGAHVVATYRKEGSLAAYEGRPDVTLYHLDIEQPESFAPFTDRLRADGRLWDLVIFGNATMTPIGRFLDLDGAAWQQTINANAMLPCRLLQGLYPLRRPGRVNDVAFFAGGGTNNPFTNYSAYCLSKILLIKMCELIDDEAEDLNAFIVGPGYVRTKIHDETLQAGANAGGNLDRTRTFLETDGTPMDDIFACIEWCVAQGRSVVGGRNLSVVHDPWKQEGGAALAASLTADRDRFKLRRAGNA